MKFTFDKEWLQKHAERDDNLEIAAGSFSLDQLPPAGGDPGDDATAVLAFGRLINLSRRTRDWSVEDLAAKARIEVSEVIRIEHDTGYVPGPRTVYQLSVALDLPKERLMQLSGNMIVRDSGLGQRAVKFAAQSESVQKLNQQEHQALEEFVKYLHESR
jgi:transcriptional regulator with XRE-family HTH domain